jgi:alkyl hydroperoxide reductase subunit AhpC
MNMRTPLAALAALALVSTPMVAQAALPKGAVAPDFTAQGALGGKPFSIHLKQALKRGPVVLYFYPKAFTQGCTLEAHAFADATPDFAKAGATVIGMSNDDVATLTRFSTEECRNKFAVASATPTIIKAYDVDLQQAGKSTGLTTRTSYVIAPSGKVTMVHSDMDYRDHVKLTLAAVQALKGRR